MSEPVRAEYDFTGAERGKYAGRYAEGSNVVVLDPDVAAAFPDAKAVNDALRKIAGLDQSGPKTTRRSILDSSYDLVPFRPQLLRIEHPPTFDHALDTLRVRDFFQGIGVE